MLLALSLACSSPEPATLQEGAYVQERWQLLVTLDEATGVASARLGTDCGDGWIDDLGVVDGAFDVSFDWLYGGGAMKPEPVPATLSGAVSGDTIDALFTVDGAEGTALELVLGEGLVLKDCG